MQFINLQIDRRVAAVTFCTLTDGHQFKLTSKFHVHHGCQSTQGHLSFADR